MPTAKLFTNGGSQAVRIPKEFQFEGKEVYLNKIGECLMIMPVDKVWEVCEMGQEMLSSEIMPERKQPTIEESERED